MPFDADEIERMTPAVREELQHYLLRVHFARQRRAQFGKDRAPFQIPESRIPWPHRIGFWPVNDSQRRLERELAIRDGLRAR